MNPSFTLIALIGFAATTQAQPVITAAQAPAPGTNYSLHFGPYVAQGNAGADQTWDFSALTSDSTMSIMLVEPSSVEGFEAFPGATVAEVGNDAVMFWRIATDGIYQVGSLSEDVVINYDDQGKYLQFPCTFQTTWNDDVQATFEAESMSVVRSGSIEGSADGYGTLIMPDGTYENVLRVRWLESSLDSTEFFEVASVYDSYLYYIQGQSYPVAHVVSATITFMGIETVAQFTQWYTGDISTGVADTFSGNVEMKAWPNPATDRVQLQLPQHMDGEIFIQVMDAIGKAAYNGRYIADGQGRIELSIAGLKPGIYLVNALDANGNKATVRLSVE